jgi:hypothetical protein
MKQRRINATLIIAALTLTTLLILTALPQAGTAAPAVASLSTNPKRINESAEAHLSIRSPFVDNSPGTTTRVSTAFRSNPVMFIENVGQFDDRARFQVRGSMGTMWLAEDAIWITVVERLHVDTLERSSVERADMERANEPRRGVNLKLSFPGANPTARIEPFDRLDTVVSYFIGNAPDKWHPDVPVWGGVRYVDLYPDIDLEITSENGQMAQHLVARLGADLNAVRLRVEGADTLALDGDTLRLTTAVGDLTLPLLAVEGATLKSQLATFKLECGTFEVSSPFSSAPLLPQYLAHLQDNPEGLLYSTFLAACRRGNRVCLSIGQV